MSLLFAGRQCGFNAKAWNSGLGDRGAAGSSLSSVTAVTLGLLFSLSGLGFLIQEMRVTKTTLQSYYEGYPRLRI